MSAGEGRPFLSVVVPAGGAGAQALRETLLCLTGQDDHDFEVVVVGAGLGPDQLAAVEQVLADQPPSRAHAIRLIRIDPATPGAARNAGLAVARGRYLTVVNEGDLLLGAWVQTFHDAEAAHAGCLLRAQSVAQPHVFGTVRGYDVVRADGSPRATYPTSFSLWQHALEPLTPPASWAWPRSGEGDRTLAPEELAPDELAYDESVDDPDWELLVRAAQTIETVDLPRVTSIHRQWRTEDQPPQPAGVSTRDLINSRPLLLPAGEALRLAATPPESGEDTALRAELDRTREELRLTHDHATNLQGLRESLEARIVDADERHEKEVARLRRKLERLRGEAENTSSPDVGSPRRSRLSPRRQRD